MLDDLYWVMSCSRWKDERYWPAFRDLLTRASQFTDDSLLKAKESMPSATIMPVSAATRRTPRWRAGSPTSVDPLVPAAGYVHGEKPTSVDAAIYGFIANIYFYPIETPLKQSVLTHANIVRHCRSIHETVTVVR